MSVYILQQLSKYIEYYIDELSLNKHIEIEEGFTSVKN